MQSETLSAKQAHPGPAKGKKLVLFDFDGTITTRDTLLEFLRFYRGNFRFFAGMMLLSPVLALYVLKLIPNWRAKEKCLRYFLGAEPFGEFQARCRSFAASVLPKLIRPQALKAISQHAAENATIAVVSASAENWIGPWCEQHGLICIGTQLEVKDGQITGNLCGENCYGPVKVKRLNAQFNLSEFEEIIAYGDSSGDREMFAIAHRHFYRPFRLRSVE